MKKIILLLMISLIGFFIYKSRSDSTSLITPLRPVPTLTVVPTPTPIIFDQHSNLEEEVQNLTPEDFSADFNFLKESVSTF